MTITQEIIASLLGVNRSSITKAANSLRKAGLIDYSRGTIKIIDRAGLEKQTCECYEVIKKAVETYITIKRRN
jgi:Mn-dependent DtxR family transcriptional regulator